MASVTWNSEAMSANAAIAPDAPPGPAEVPTQPQQVQRFLLQQRGQRPLEVLGLHMLRLSGPETEGAVPKHHIDVYETVDGGFAVSVLQERGGEVRPIGACTGRSLSDVTEYCLSIDPLASVPYTDMVRSAEQLDASPVVALELIRSFEHEACENFANTVRRLEGQAATELNRG